MVGLFFVVGFILISIVRFKHAILGTHTSAVCLSQQVGSLVGNEKRVW